MTKDSRRSASHHNYDFLFGFHGTARLGAGTKVLIWDLTAAIDGRESGGEERSNFLMFLLKSVLFMDTHIAGTA